MPGIVTPEGGAVLAQVHGVWPGEYGRLHHLAFECGSSLAQPLSVAFHLPRWHNETGQFLQQAVPQVRALKLDVIGEPDAAGFRALSLATDRDSDLGESLLRALAADSRFRLRSLGRDHPTLEDVFLAATRRSWDVVDAPQSSK